MKKVFCIIVTYNGMQWIDRCLLSLQNCSSKISVIVIDNGSVDNTVGHITKHYPWVRLVISERNLGFGQGNNVGLKLAVEELADYVFLLNQDAWIENDTVEKLINSHQKHPEYGIISPVHLNGTGNDFDDHFIFFLKQSEIQDLIWEHLKNQPVSDKLIRTKFVNAAAWLISKECLHRVGGFDPIFFHYGEDDNYAQRVIYHQWMIGVLPSAFIWHDKDRYIDDAIPDYRREVRKEWTQTLVYACDVNRSSFYGLMIKRIIRHFIDLMVSVFRFSKWRVKYNWALLCRMIVSFQKIYKSRKLSRATLGFTHLKN